MNKNCGRLTQSYDFAMTQVNSSDEKQHSTTPYNTAYQRCFLGPVIWTVNHLSNRSKRSQWSDSSYWKTVHKTEVSMYMYLGDHNDPWSQCQSLVYFVWSSHHKKLLIHMCSHCSCTPIPFFRLKEQQINIIRIDCESGQTANWWNDLLRHG